MIHQMKAGDQVITEARIKLQFVVDSNAPSDPCIPF